MLTCVQCDTNFTAVIYDGPDGRSLALLPSTYGGLTTPHTPPGVAYYLDQAQRSQSTGANSAAVAMFRGALEHLLFEQGFTKGTCGTKLIDLEKAVAAGTAPKWANELDGEFLQVMKKLGDGPIHPGDGDVGKQAACPKSSLREASPPTQEGLCWQARTNDLFGLPSPTSTGFRESRSGRTGLRTKWIQIMR
jgi:hypothetical protein